MNPIWRLVRKLFGKPKGRHALGVPPPAPDEALPFIDSADFNEPAPEPISMPAPEPEPTPVVVPAPDPVVLSAPVAVPAPIAVPVAVPAQAPVAAPTPASPLVAPLADLGPVRLIFSDGTIAPLPAGSPEERRARYLAQRVLEATGRH